MPPVFYYTSNKFINLPLAINPKTAYFAAVINQIIDENRHCTKRWWR
jgi:hypothetical protein